MLSYIKSFTQWVNVIANMLIIPYKMDIFNAILTNDVEVVRNLIDTEGVDIIKSKDNNDNVPLYHAVCLNRPNIAELLLKHNAYVNERDDSGDSVLYIASCNNYIEVAKVLLSNYAYVNIKNAEGNTPLHGAAAYGHINMVRLLLEYNANVNITNYNNHTPINITTNDDIKELLILYRDMPDIKEPAEDN